MESSGQRIKSRRLKLKLTQKELAKRVGVAHVTISQWERGDTSPRGDRLFSLAEALDCEASWVLRGDSSLAETPTAEVTREKEQLTSKETILLDLFSGLPESEQEQLIKTLEEKKEHYARLLTELLNARDRKKA
ncbi:helix-turn-helix domain-containing protein [Candidatus Fukatsuia symbiotica]|uniref:HTH cro/C1-type domain-containing protein n=1 Tax=Candidatus Fukatsuia symbiotica TaxID=1878942 RepID=A0A2U8I322_9GAMM|nr:helix-turn-helix domain-containing protein [Candidatus Fukatsuia symbiotica]AWK13517.1 hypothetical protein CCS41_01780 [Candidatus Fukatsuia symbiotica]MEA9444423.1 helix-turn-helix domain-containing protein [Candidatus Fukatsuia symbiotica]